MIRSGLRPPSAFRHILITGASSGIGAALALHYSRIPDVMLSLSGRDEARLMHIATACRAAGADMRPALVDVTDAPAMADWIAHCDRVRPLDLAIANAGISAGTLGIGMAESPDQIARLFDTNVQGVFNTVLPALTAMRPRAGGHIALVSSLAGFRGWPGASAYCATKAAIRVYGEGLAGAATASGIKIHVICPGFVRTPMTDVNGFPMPFMISAERAAAIIARGIARNRGRIAFPIASYALTRLVSALPDRLAQLILRQMPKKPPHTH